MPPAKRDMPSKRKASKGNRTTPSVSTKKGENREEPKTVGATAPKTAKQQVRLLNKQLKRVAARVIDETGQEKGPKNSATAKGKGRKRSKKTGLTRGAKGKVATQKSRQAVIADNLAYLQCL